MYKTKARYEGSGVFLMYATIAVGMVMLIISSREIHARYLLPVLGVFWLSASIIIGKIENTKLLAVMLAFIMVFAATGICITHDDINSRFEFNEKKASFLHSINNNDSIIIYDTDFGYQVLHADLNKTKQYSVKDTYFYGPDIEISGNIHKIIEKNPEKNIYLVLWDNQDQYSKYHLKEKFESGYGVYQIEK
ncbi:hypothetical protein [Methanobrevibacter sp.]|uniref:hypothetical protein n=1 Tax=Methanobrevibacter sp. TaxID=66852 RepID=UPI00388D231B